MLMLMRFGLALLIVFASIITKANELDRQREELENRQAVAAGDVNDGHIVEESTKKVLYGVLLREGAEEIYSKSFLSDERHQSWHRGKVVNLVLDFEWRYGIEILSMTSWVHSSFSAYLSKDELDRLADDPRVVDMEPIRRGRASQSFNDTNAVWSDSFTIAPGNPPFSNVTTLVSEVQSWGKRATSPSVLTNSTSDTLVYVIDGGGVGLHEDLDNVIQRININNVAGLNCGTRAGLSACTTAQLSKLIGCNTHSTAVAGVIGAKSNSKGVVGVNPGVKMVSVATFSPGSGTCLPDGVIGFGYGTGTDLAMDWIYQDILNNNHTGKPSVVNLSVNYNSASGPYAPFDNAVRRVATATAGYPGAVFVQSAGNYFQSACYYSYNGVGSVASSNDGVLVVGAINNHGQPVVPLNNAPGFWKQPYQGPGNYFGHEAGSDYGPCVDMWAPGDAIFTTLGPLQTQGTSTYNTYGYMSGTSFSAPHVAGLASYLIEHRSLTTPAAVEQALRGADILFPLGSREPPSIYKPGGGMPAAAPLGAFISIPTLSPLSASVPHNTPYAEYIISKSCLVSPESTTYRSSCGFDTAKNINYRVNKIPFSSTGSLLSGMIPNWGTLARTATESIWMNFDSYGTGSYSCDLYLTNASGSSLIATSISNPTTAPYYWRNFPTISTASGQQFTSLCSSARAVIN